MARIAVVTHELDHFRHPWYRRLRSGPSEYLLHDLLAAMERRGHDVEVIRGIDRSASADVAIAHVDCSRTPERYLDYVRSFPAAINARVEDVTKRRVSEALVDRDTDWTGAVIVKSDLNYRRLPEIKHNVLALLRCRRPPHPGCWIPARYRTFASPSAVPERFWRDDRWVVERFVPETSDGGYAMRTWVFVNGADRCRRHRGGHPLLKVEDIVETTPAPVPDRLRAVRRRLGFDFGKFDFVVHDGEPVLLDANKTPGTAPWLRERIDAGRSDLPDGLEEMLP